MPSVGSVSFDAMHGLPQSYITPSQINAVQQGCLSIGMTSPESPSEDGGEIETTAKKADEAACIALAADCRALVGFIVTITVDTGVTVPYQFVSGVECKWKRVGGLGANLYVFTAKWKLVPLKYTNSNGEDNTTLAEVYTAKVWGTWTRQTKVKCYGAAEGLGSYAGECDIVQKIGLVNGVPEDELDILGKWVEIRAKEAPTGSIPKPVWWGKVVSKQITRLESGAEVNFHCVGLVDALRQVQLNRWYDLVNETTVCDPGSMLPFNDKPVGNVTENAVFDLDDPVGMGTHKVHQRKPPSGKAWSAYDVLETVLAAIASQYPGGPTWTLSGQTEALDYIFTGNFESSNVFDILQACVNPGRSLYFHIKVPLSGIPVRSGDTVNIEICSALPVAVNLPGKGNPAPDPIAIPAAVRREQIDLTPTEVTDWSLSEDASELYDDIFMQAPRPLHTATVGFSAADASTAPASISETPTARGQLTKDWTNAEETTWASATEARRNQPDLAHVWRRYRLRALWKGNYRDGSLAGSTTAKNIAREVDGTGAETGEWTTGGTWPDGRNIKFTRSLPIPQGLRPDDYATGNNNAAIDHKKHPEKIQVFKVLSNTWTTINELYEITVTGDGAAIEIGRNAVDGLAIKNLLAGGYDIVFIVGYEWPLPWRVSWRRSAPGLAGNLRQTPADLDRSVIIPLTGAMHTWVVWDRKCVVRVVSGAPERANADINIYKPGTIYQALELARVRYSTPQRSAAWTVSGSVDLSDDMQPGALITKADVPYGTRASKLREVNAILTRRSWNFLVANPSTSYAAEPMLPNVSSVIHMGIGANGPAGGAFPGGIYK